MLNTVTWMLIPAVLNNFPLPCPSWGGCTMSWLQALSQVKNKLAKRVIFNLGQSLLGSQHGCPALVWVWRHREQQKGDAGGTEGCLKPEHSWKVLLGWIFLLRTRVFHTQPPSPIPAVFLKAISRTNITADKALAEIKQFLVVMSFVADLFQSKFYSSFLFAVVQSGSNVSNM